MTFDIEFSLVLMVSRQFIHTTGTTPVLKQGAHAAFQLDTTTTNIG